MAGLLDSGYMEERIKQLEKKVTTLEARIMELEMKGAASVAEGLGALEAELKRDIERLESRINNMRAH